MTTLGMVIIREQKNIGAQLMANGQLFQILFSRNTYIYKKNMEFLFLNWNDFCTPRVSSGSILVFEDGQLVESWIDVVNS